MIIVFFMENKILSHNKDKVYKKRLMFCTKKCAMVLKKTKWYKNNGFVVVSKCSLKEE